MPMTAEGVRKAVRNFHLPKAKRGRKKGWRKTTSKENASILKTFHRVRPPGAGVESREVSDALPKRLLDKVCLRTIRNRLKEKGYVPERKIEKSEANKQVRSGRMCFCTEHKWRTRKQWKRKLQAAGYMKGQLVFPIFFFFLLGASGCGTHLRP